MDGGCDKHVFEKMAHHCRRCGGEFCTGCLVYSHGPKKPPYCVNCALSAAGIRSTAARPAAPSQRETRRMLKTQRKADKVSAKARRNVGAEELFETGPEPADAPASPPAQAPHALFEFTINDDGTVHRPVAQAG